MLLSSLSLISRRLLLLAGGLLVLLPAPVQAQFAVEYRTRAVTAGAPANFFFDWDGASLAGVELELPVGWRLQALDAIRGGFERLPGHLTAAEQPTNRFRMDFRRPESGLIRFVVRATSPIAPSEDDLIATPLIRSGEVASQPEPGLQAIRRIHVRPPQRPGANRALTIEPRDPPVRLRAEELPDLSTDHTYTVEMWLKTTGLGCVVLSTWDGDEATPYPLEMVIAPQGRLMVYRGRPGFHQAMTSFRPVADGEWHHVALSHEPHAGWTRLHVDGLPQDSLFDPTPSRVPMGDALVLSARTAPDNAEARCPVSIDELRVWAEARSVEQIRQAMRTPMGDQVDEHLLLSFDEEVPGRLLDGANVLRRERTDLTFVHPVQNVQVAARDQTVTLSWETSDTASRSFTIERSSDGQIFQEVGYVDAGLRVDDDPVTGRSRYRFTEARVGEDVVYYRIRQRLSDGTERVTASVKMGLGADHGDESAILIGNYPNPFRSRTTITYRLKDRTHARVSVWDVSGQPVAELVNELQDTGFHEIPFEPDDLPSGTYFVRLQTPTDIAWRTLTLTK